MSLFSGSDLLCLRGARVVFAGLDFALDPGGALLLVGPNGSGKSSLLRLMAGLLKPWGGQMFWDGAPTNDDLEAHRTRTHYVGHADALKPVLTAAENLEFWASLDSSRANSQNALERLGAATLADVPTRFLSAGQKRRVTLARLLASPRPLWLLDEPTTALDREGIALLTQEIAAHRNGGGIVVASTHADLQIPDAAVLQVSDFAAGVAE